MFDCSQHTVTGPVGNGVRLDFWVFASNDLDCAALVGTPPVAGGQECVGEAFGILKGQAVPGFRPAARIRATSDVDPTGAAGR